MISTPLTSSHTSSTILGLSKRAWKLGIALSKLDQDSDVVDPTVKVLTEEVKALGVECDLIYAELDEVAGKNGPAPPSLNDVVDGVSACLEVQVGDIGRSMQELEMFVDSVRGEDSRLIGQAQRQRRLNGRRNQIASIRTKVCRQTDNLRTTLLLMNTMFAHLVTGRVDRRFSQVLDKLQDAVERLQRSLESDPHSQPSELTLLQCARDLLEKGTTMYKACIATEGTPKNQSTPRTAVRVVDWVTALDSLRRDQQAQKRETAIGGASDDSDDDLEIDFAKSALDTGISAFESREWTEADSLLQEALRVLQHLKRRQCTFCDIFNLHYRLAICAYYVQEPAGAEEALISFLQQQTNSDDGRAFQYDAMHLLSQLYVRTGHIDRARSECEKTLQGRRKLLGKQSDAALESMALMAHIFFVINNRVRAKSCLGLIPEERRPLIIKNVEDTLGLSLEHLDFSSFLVQSPIEDPDVKAISDIQLKLATSSLGTPTPTLSSISTLLPTDNTNRSIFSFPKPPNSSPQLSYRRIPSNRTSFDAQSNPGVSNNPPYSSTPQPQEDHPSSTTNLTHLIPERTHPSNSSISPDAASFVQSDPDTSTSTTTPQPLTRSQLLQNLNCQPRTALESAVCSSSHAQFHTLLKKQTSFLRSTLRKHVKPERLTALHFAALFGEIEMARLLLAAGFGINDVPYGYSTALSPLKMAVGARRVEMVDFLLANGAGPGEGETWAGLVGAMLSRGWIGKTVGEGDREGVVERIVGVMGILVGYGWEVNAPCDKEGNTALHLAVGFWSGEYAWDLGLRRVVTAWLCEKGADPLVGDKEGKTAYDLVVKSGHLDLAMLLDGCLKDKGARAGNMEPVELEGSLGMEHMDSSSLTPEI
ncbi:hypothetical protein B0J11DRAFT_562638 [Dendryphion nanum]|uniref:Ankyrin n=1 Tax=Dendryphion nanum TaxID=256645 RepID=A0A9P9I8J3_9PLEO|nr:hypothetical protein B0J11DRAFT_562638 [Dendryphion nanum]